MPKKKEYKVVILGSGPAGLTAALYASRANLEPLVVEGGGGEDPTDVPGGQLMLTTDVDNYPGFPEGILGPELMEKFRKQAARFGTEYAPGALEEADLGRRPFVLKLDGGEVRAEALIIATGARAKWLGLPEELEFRTRIGGVSACATCDGFFYKGKEVLVVGGGDTAMEEATFLTKFATRATVVHRRDTLRASKIMQERAFKNPKITFVWNTELDAIGDPAAGKVSKVTLRDVKTGALTERPVDGLFLAIGHEPNTTLFKGQLDLLGNGYVKIEPGTTRTSVPGVFAAGDVADYTFRQAVTAAGTGCMAALEAERYLEAAQAG
jgi:thioredoxin reductase (NADPH)